jgi:2'-5' RNA ligase
VRLFLGVPATGAVQAAALDLSRQLERRTSALAPHARIAWVAADRFHLTVLFIGHVSPPQVDGVRHSLNAPFAEPRFELTLAGAGVFPPSSRPRVIWAGCREGTGPFTRLQREAYARIAAVLPLEPERDARPHLTLARVKDAGGLPAAALLAGTEDVPPGTLPVSAVTLFESRPVRSGVEYVPLLEVPLDGVRAV